MVSAAFGGGDSTYITLNGEAVEVGGSNEEGQKRGLHIVVLDPLAGKVSSAQVFDTYESSSALDTFIAQDRPDGSIIIAACHDDCANKLSAEAKQWFTNMGST